MNKRQKDIHLHPSPNVLQTTELRRRKRDKTTRWRRVPYRQHVPFCPEGTWRRCLRRKGEPLHLNAGVPLLSEAVVWETLRQAELGCNLVQVPREGHVTQQVDLTVGEPRLDPLLQQLQNVQSAGEANNRCRRLGGLGHVQQVVEQRLVPVVGEQVELVQDEQQGATAAAVTCPGAQTSA